MKQIFWSSVLAVWLIAGAAGAKPVDPLVAPDGVRAFVHTYGPTPVLAEVWIAGAPTAAWPGVVTGMAWAGTDLLIRVRPLSLAMFGTRTGRRVSLAPGGVWRLGRNGMLAPAQGDLPALAPVSAEIGPALNALQPHVQAGLNAATIAYDMLHRWDFNAAAQTLAQAAKHFAAAAEVAKAQGLSPLPFAHYEQALKAQADSLRTDGAARVCREHLAVIGDLIAAYADAHQGDWPPALIDLKHWAQQVYPALAGSVLDRLFRAALDDRKGAPISYVYYREAAPGEPVATSAFWRGRAIELVRTRQGFLVQDRPVGCAQVDSLLASGARLLEAKDVRAVVALEMVTRVAPDLARAHCLLGQAYLLVRDFDHARSAFDRARHLDHRMAEAYYGLGLVAREEPMALYNAIRYFQTALRWKHDYLQARFAMAQTRFELEEYDVKRDLEAVLALDSNYAPAYLLMGRWFAENQEDYENATVYLAQYTALKPDDPEGRRLLAEAYLQVKNYGQVVAVLSEHVRQHPEHIDMLPVLAQACLEQGRADWAEAYFNTYLAGIPPEERALYEDISLIASKEEWAVYTGLDKEARTRFLQKFWGDRDPNLLTEANERRLEHYRRVWYARQHFSSGQAPWDRRGEVYIRFGEPDHRTTSAMLNAQQSLKVQRLKERLAQQLYGEEAAQANYFGPVYPVRSLRSKLGGGAGLEAERDRQPVSSAQIADQRQSDRQLASNGEEQRTEGTSARTGIAGQGGAVGADGELERLKTESAETVGDPEQGTGLFDYHPDFQPVSTQEDGSMVPWESWVYTDVGTGIEITFTDERHQGVFDFAPVPMDAHLSVGMHAKLNRYSPRRLTEEAALMMPDYYVDPVNDAPLAFYYDLADFRGENGKTRFEVYFGVPYRIGHFVADRKATELLVERTVALVNEETGAVRRTSGRLAFEGQGDLTRAAGGFVPDLVAFDMPVGRYRMEVAVTDRLSGRQGRYRQIVDLKSYGEKALGLSDLELAWQATEGGPEDQFRKRLFHIVPLPTRTYPRGRSVFVYYEIYNLQRDKFGQTQYQVEYTIGPRDTHSLGGIMSRLVRTFSGKKENTAVSYEQVGAAATEPAYMELDLSDCAPGRQVLRVKVSDLISGQSVVKEALFVVAE